MTPTQQLNQMMTEANMSQGSDAPTEAIPKVAGAATKTPKKKPVKPAPAPPSQSEPSLPPRPQPSKKSLPPKPQPKKEQPQPNEKTHPATHEDQWAPVHYDGTRPASAAATGLVLGIGFVIAALVGCSTQAQPTLVAASAVLGVLGIIVAVGFGILLKQTVIEAVEQSYGIMVIRSATSWTSHSIQVSYATPHHDCIRKATVVFSPTVAWLLSADDPQTIIPRSN